MCVPAELICSPGAVQCTETMVSCHMLTEDTYITLTERLHSSDNGNSIHSGDRIGVPHGAGLDPPRHLRATTPFHVL